MTISHTMAAFHELNEMNSKFKRGEITREQFDQHLKEAEATAKRLSSKLKKTIKDEKESTTITT